jgi:GR25 family glycosyltransferase involved in LPS biosynthesis
MPIKNTIVNKYVHLLPFTTSLSTSINKNTNGNVNNVIAVSPSNFRHAPNDKRINFETFIINLKEETKLLQNVKHEIFQKSTNILHNFQIIEGINVSTIPKNKNKNMALTDPLQQLITDKKLLKQDYDEIIRKEKLNIKVEAIELTRGSIGCALSHIQIWENILTGTKYNNDTYFIVLEDDVYVTHDFDSKLKHYMNKMPKDFDIIYLGTQYYVKYQHIVQNADLKIPSNYRSSNGKDPDTDDKPLPFLKKVLYDHYGTFGYMISKNGAQKLLRNVYPLKQQIDSYIIDATIHNVNGNGNVNDDQRLNVYMFHPHLVYELKTLHASKVQNV